MVVLPADAGAFRQAMLEMSTDDARVHAMGQAALERFQTHFTAQQTARAYARLYREVLQPGDKAERLK